MADTERRRHFLKARSAINLGGHRPDVVVWLDEADGGWVTSTAFATAPVPFLPDFIAKHPMRRRWAARGIARCRTNGSRTNTRARTAARIPPSRGSFRTSKGRGAEVGGAITDAWESSPFSDAYLGGDGDGVS